VLGAALAAPGAHAQTAVGQRAPTLAEARAAYENADFAGTLEALSSVEDGTGLSRDDVLALLELRALTEFATGASGALDSTLTRLLSLEPGYTPGPASAPRFAAVVETVRARGILPLELAGEATLETSGVRITLRTVDPSGLVRAHRIHWREDGREQSAEGSDVLVPTEQSSLDWWAEALGPGGAVLAQTERTDAAAPSSAEDSGPQPSRAGDDDATLAIVLGIVAGVALVGGAVAVGPGVAGAPGDTVVTPVVRWWGGGGGGPGGTRWLRWPGAPDPVGEGPGLSPPTPVKLAQGRVGRYELCFHLAAGGMATVYLARLEGPDGFEKLVAVKTIHPHLAEDRRFVDMFLDEARIASRISHGNVCQTFDYGEAGGTWYIAMEYLVGECFATVYNRLLKHRALVRDPRSRATLLAMFAAACEGLHAAHELRDSKNAPLGIVHRDVSHHNVFVTYDGSVKVVDFGIATAADRLHRTATGEVKGKFAYMSPEQARGERVDRTTDVWALGVMIWEFLTGRRLFGRKNESATVLALATEAVRPPSYLEPSIPPELDAVVLRALDRDPARRWPSARELGLALIAASGEKRGSIGGPEIAALVGGLFPDGRAAREALADLARRRSADSEELPVELTRTLVALRPTLADDVDPITDVREAARAGTAEIHMSPTALRAAPAGTERFVDVVGAAPSGERAVESRSDAGPRAALTYGAIAGTVIAAVLIGVWIGRAGPVPALETETTLPPIVAAPATATLPAPGTTAASPTAPPPTTTLAPPPTTTLAPPPTTSTLEGHEGEAPRDGSDHLDRGPGTTATPPPPARPGQLNVVAPGTWAEVRVAGRSYQTPCQISLPAGRHRLEILVRGREPTTQIVSIRRDEATRIVVGQ